MSSEFMPKKGGYPIKGSKAVEVYYKKENKITN